MWSATTGRKVSEQGGKKQTAPSLDLSGIKVIGVESFNSAELLLTHRENTDMGFCSNTLFGMFLAFVAVAH